jgi:hypothetical protein
LIFRALAPADLGAYLLTVVFSFRGKPMIAKPHHFLSAAALVLAFAAAPGGQAQAAGCLKGAVVGGIAGHYAGHHAVAGAIGGCIVGHHMATVNAEKQKQLQQQNQPTPAPTPAPTTKSY